VYIEIHKAQMRSAATKLYGKKTSMRGEIKMGLVKSIRAAQGWKGWVRDILIACVIALLIMVFIKPTIVQERSMQPTLYADNYILLSRQAYLISEPQPGDIVVFNSTLPLNEDDNDGHKLLIKRVIAVYGDHLVITGGNVYINGERKTEPYLAEMETSGEIDRVIPRGTVFVMGDNRRHSVDSRSDRVDLVNIDDIIGRAFFRLFPFNAVGPVR
jgi:signal peptidase I